MIPLNAAIRLAESTEGALVKPKGPARVSVDPPISSASRHAWPIRIGLMSGGPTIVDIYTDSACSGHPGPGGWGTILRYGENEKELSGGAAQDDEQSYGTECRDRSVTRSQTTVARADSHGQHLRKGRHNEVDRQLETQRLADRR